MVLTALTLAIFCASANIAIAWYVHGLSKRLDKVDTKDLRHAFEHLERSTQDMWDAVNSHLGRISRLKRTMRDDKIAAAAEAGPQTEAAPAQASKGETEALPISRTELLLRARGIRG